jgi:hypothetical protein
LRADSGDEFGRSIAEQSAVGAAAFASERALLVGSLDDGDVTAATTREDAADIDAKADIGGNVGGAAHGAASVEMRALI